MFGKIVLDVPGELFEDELHDLVEAKGFTVDTELSARDLAGLVETFKGIVQKHAGVEFPTDPTEQLRYAIEAVFKSWNGKRARDYRKFESIPDDLGTAVNVQAMVFGNKGDDSGTGVAFTRNPSTGESAALRRLPEERAGRGRGRRHPHHRAARRRWRNEFPERHQQLLDVMQQLENHYRDMCDIEFTIEQGRLFMLQTRVGKRTAAAALRMAVEMVSEGLIDEREAVLRVQPAQLDQLLHPQFDPKAEFHVLAKGLNASPGAAVGKVSSPPTKPRPGTRRGEHVILVRPETSPDDLHGMIAAEGILTSRGGLVSHAAVVARGMGKPAICGAEAVDIDLTTKQFVADGTTVREGDVISINGTTGEIVAGRGARDHARADRATSARSSAGPTSYRRLKVRTNADLPEDAKRAREFGAEGIGLCRTEHMFLGDRLPIVQRMILADNPADEDAALEELRAAAGVRLRRHPRGDGRPAGDGAAARPAAARVPARSRGADRQAGQGRVERSRDASC